MSPPLPNRLDAGTITRGELLAVHQQGAARFLQRVRVEPERVDGEFIGWRLVALFPNSPELRAASILKAGDLLLRVNGHSVRRPEQFLSVWASLPTSGELVFEIVRGDQPSQVRYLIDDDNLGTTPDAAPIP